MSDDYKRAFFAIAQAAYLETVCNYIEARFADADDWRATVEYRLSALEPKSQKVGPLLNE